MIFLEQTFVLQENISSRDNKIGREIIRIDSYNFFLGLLKILISKVILDLV